MKQRDLLINMIRLGLVFLCVAAVFFVLLPNYLNSFAEYFPFRQAIVGLIENYPGYHNEWLSIASFITVSMYIYGYSAVMIIVNILYQFQDDVLKNNDDAYKWNLFHVMIVRLAMVQKIPSGFGIITDYKSMFSVIRAYSKSREGLGSILFDLIAVVAWLYIGYNGLQAPTVTSSLLTRIIDVIMVGFWCYCVYSIFMWFVFVLVAWTQCLRRYI